MKLIAGGKLFRQLCKDLYACARILSVEVEEKDEELQFSELDVARLDRECWSEENGLDSVINFAFGTTVLCKSPAQLSQASHLIHFVQTPNATALVDR